MRLLDRAMESGGQCLFVESVEENELTPERVPLAYQSAASSNCSSSYKNENLSSDNGNAILAAGIPPNSIAEKNFKSGEPLNSPPSTINSRVDVTPLTTKGYGLKKWRRIRRDFREDLSVTTNSNKVLKRVLPTPTNPNKPFRRSEALVGSTSGMRYDGTVDGSAAQGLSLNYGFAAASTFVAAADSDNSDDRSSKSSTSASVSKVKSEVPSGSGYALEKNGIKNVSGKNLSGSTKGALQGRSRVEISKKQRGERIKIKKENSHSSLGSESRSSNFVFTQANFSPTSNRRIGQYDGECGNDAEESELLFSKEVLTGYSQQNSGELADCSHDGSAAEMPWKVRKEKQENHHHSVHHDPLVESILSLKSVQESLERG